MAAPDANNVIVPGLAHVYTAPYGTTLPDVSDFATDPVDLGFVDVGHTEDKGIGFNFKLDKFTAKSHQSLDDIVNEITGRDVSWNIPLLETMASDALVLALGGGSVAVTGGVGRFTPAAAGERVDLSAVIDLISGTKEARWVIPHVAISGDVKTTFARGALPVLPVNLAVIVAGNEDPFYFDSNASGMTSTSPIDTIAVSPATKALSTSATFQLTATATLEDTTTEDVTTPASWSSSAPSKCTVSSTGLITGVSAGTANITAAYKGVTSSACAVTVS